MPTGGFSWNRKVKAKFAQMFPLQEIKNVIQERYNQSVSCTKTETAQQTWPNLRYKTYSHFYLSELFSFV
jgi:hypothetical protein